MTQIYSPLGGWADVPGSEAAELVAKGWFIEGTPGFVDRYAVKKAADALPLVAKPETGTIGVQPEEPRRVGRPRRGSAPGLG